MKEMDYEFKSLILMGILSQSGSEGTGDGQFLHLHDIAVGPGDSNRSSVNQEATSAQPLIGSGNASQSANNDFVYVTDNEPFNVYLPRFLSI